MMFTARSVLEPATAVALRLNLSAAGVRRSQRDALDRRHVVQLLTASVLLGVCLPCSSRPH